MSVKKCNDKRLILCLCLDKFDNNNQNRSFTRKRLMFIFHQQFSNLFPKIIRERRVGKQ